MIKSHAVVIGGSLAGLTAARVLASYFDRVTIIERDRFPVGPGPRKGLPQAHHVHILLWRGQLCLEKLYPGLQEELGQAGAPQVDWIEDACWYSFGGWAPRFHSGYTTHPCSRDLLEWIIRKRTTTISQVTILEECEAAGLLTNETRSVVTGVRYRQRDQPEGDYQEITADLVVDASGRETRTPRWLEALGYALPQDTVINSFLGYSSRVYQKPRGLYDWKSLIVRGTPPANKRGGAINPIEGERWMVTLAGAGHDYPPNDEAGFLEFARSLPVAEFFDAIKDAHPLTPISGYRKTENRWRHFERTPRWPENLVVTGDAVCAFNPVYGQGMTTAALGAITLDECLQDLYAGKNDPLFAHNFQKKLARVIAAPWLLATGDDFRYPETVGGKRDAATHFMHRYVDHVFALANENEHVFTNLFQVAQLIKPITAIFQPGILMLVLNRLRRPQAAHIDFPKRAR